MGRLKNLVRNINYLSKHSLWDQREEDIVYLTEKILDDGLYEYGIELPNKKSIKILTQEETLSLIEQQPKSFVRTGDGEIGLILGNNQPFQKYEKEIADILKRLLNTKRNDIYVGINRNYYISLGDADIYSKFYRRKAYDLRNIYKKYLNFDNVYIDATFTSYELDQQKNEKIDSIYERWKRLFKDKNIVIVCGNGILNGYKYDVFELAKNKVYINAPRKDAWDEKERIIQHIKRNNPKDCIVVFILGMAGKAMIPELTDCGYMCWDVGHLAKYYNAYMQGKIMTEDEIKAFYAPD